MNAPIKFQGWKTTYIISKPNEYVDAILDSLRQVEVNGTLVDGESVTQVMTSLRDKGFKVPGRQVDQEKLARMLGFSVTKAKVGKWTAGGYKYCQPAKVITLGS